MRGRTVTLKVEYADFHQITRSQLTARPVGSRDELERAALVLLSPLLPVPKGVRLLGVTILSFANEADDVVKVQFDLPF